MSHNTFGKNFTITSFGESHGKHIGVVIDGCPAGFEVDINAIQQDLNRRRPGQSKLTTQRNEADVFEITSGLFEGKTTGTPICILVPNTDSKPKDYDHLKEVYRPSHADFSYEKKYGIRDYRGGGRSSARITAAWVAAGSIAKQLLSQHYNISIIAHVNQIYDIQCPDGISVSKKNIEASLVRCPDENTSSKMVKAIETARAEGDSLGGIIKCSVDHMPVGVGEPVFNKLNAQLGFAMMSINAVKGFQMGSGFDSVLKKGSELNDAFYKEGAEIKTRSNNSGGVIGGISTGMDIQFDVAFKPTATISKAQQTVNKQGEAVELQAHGRHDACVVPRAVPIVEAMTALVLIDNLVHQIPQ